MSAFEVGTEHIDALLNGVMALDWQVGGARPLRWQARDLTADDERDAFAAGQPWGPRACELYDELRRELTPRTAGTVGAMLMAENRRSVDFRYDEAEIEAPYIFTPIAGITATVGRRTVASMVAQLIACFEYQACEHPGWRHSEAHAFCAAVNARCLDALADDVVGCWECADAKSVWARNVAKRVAS